ncbi:MFS transporter [Bisbaumannia pacifica]|uniref:MFS transporter n=1 Tax=Bisbaumannia pacifica TaxID=77098 RepID=A0ABD4L2M3_9GAMM|nr:MFS transporter [Halomonas pacifica]MBH8580935.1 MFS transporter [Halomonas pacifica]
MRPLLFLILALMMFPQVVETIYSPALPSIAAFFGVSVSTAGLTLSCYFVAFAFGVVFWGVMADKLGRRPAMMLGLVCYALGSAIAVYAPNFEWLLLARTLCAFGVATGSVVSQTILRDRWQGPQLAEFFSYMGMGIALSPAIGMLAGGQLVSFGGHQAVFSVLLLIALLLLAVTARALPETRREQVSVDLLALGQQMVKDSTLWRDTILVACFNVLLFGYYLQGPFLFARLGLSEQTFGYSGIALAIGTVLGSYTNKILLKRGQSPDQLIVNASQLAVISAAGVYALQSSPLFLLPMMGVVAAFAIAIPNILSRALKAYQSQLGGAGALFGLGYYLFIGTGLGISGWLENLGMSSLLCATIAMLVANKEKFTLIR